MSNDVSPGTRRVVQRIVVPGDGELDTIPLYLDFNPPGGPLPAAEPGAEAVVVPLAPVVSPDPQAILGRRTVRIAGGQRVSFGTYFNAFPAAYWRKWTTVQEVRLTLTIAGEAAVVVYRSNARGLPQRVTSLTVVDDTVSTDLSLAAFGDGGWYWFDVFATAAEAVLTDAAWDVAVPAGHVPGTVSLAITTFNRPDYCAAQLRKIGATPELSGVVSEVIVVDQGTQLVSDQPDFDEIAGTLGDRLRLIRQGNLGGSGGFARGMHETVRAGRSRYVMLLDDDIVSETEGILRAVAFADLCRKPTIVGGHMFSMYDKAQLHSFGEKVNLYRFFWGKVEGTYEAHNFAVRPLRTTAWLHRRVDVDYNGWWMCLIPTRVVDEIGLSLPVFIKWDDTEYCLRAKDAGYPTVSLPGAAVWHVPWTDKDDAIDWQAYFHQRNRWLVAMLHSPYPHGGILPRESFMIDVKHLLAMQYSAVELRLEGLEDLLRGPDHLHATIASRLADIRATRAAFPDAAVQKDPAAFPPAKRARPLRKGVEPTAPKGLVKGLTTAATGAVRQLRPVREGALVNPEVEVPAADSRWWRLSNVDSAIVSTADGTGAAWYQRDPERFRSLLLRSVDLHRRLRAAWPRLSKEYQAALPGVTSPEAWSQTFEAAAPRVPADR